MVGVRAVRCFVTPVVGGGIENVIEETEECK